ncbi:carbohydrate kinase [Paramesorhizobium deserti]|uniref:Carbohydrate kinase n=1 Tax=Paramesorhizobium deserti TaxID=1494590 RepID=A0A135I0G1_9HYPH|nr:carbohydrate kinase [Paramesorhizobium deserti]KXF78937.1 carbohydrate kinase [Paramesorhizobium deserti]
MIISCGEALIDMLPRETADGQAAFVPHAGGALFNTAIAIGRLGAPAGFFSGLSSDFLGDILRETLHRSNVDSSFCATANRPTTLAFVRLVNGQASYAFYDENTAGRMLTEADLPQLDDRVSALLFGAISLIPEPCGNTYEALMAREAGRRVIMLDPNIRPGFIPDREKHLARLRRMVAMADIVKMSDEDIAWFGEGTEHDKIAADWLTRGPKLVIITRGSHGADAYTLRGKVSVPGVKVTVADTVGAGDTVNAGVLVSLHRQGLLTKEAIANLTEDQVHAAVALGVRAAAVTVSRAGANPPWQSEMAD